MGPRVEAFERALAGAVGTADAVAVSSGTAALHLAMLALGIGPGDEVIVPAYTFPATANAVELCGARAVLVDVDPETFLVLPELVADAVTPRTRAVLAVHLFGRPVAWEELQTAIPQDVALVEDAAGALGARYRGTPCGALGLLGCLSFHPRKIVTTGGGRRRHDGRGRARGGRAAPPSPRDRSRRDGRHPGARPQLPAARRALRARAAQLERLESLLAARERVAAWYTERLSRLVGTPGVDEGDRHGWQAYVVTLDRRDEALAGLRAEGNRGADRHVRRPPALRLPRPRLVSRGGRGVRARARPAVRVDDDRGRGRPGRGRRRGGSPDVAASVDPRLERLDPRDRAGLRRGARRRRARDRRRDRLAVPTPRPAPRGRPASRARRGRARRRVPSSSSATSRATSRSCSSSAASPDRPFVAGPAAWNSFTTSLPGTGERRLRLHRRGARRRRVANAGEPRRRGAPAAARHARGAVRGGAARASSGSD